MDSTIIRAATLIAPNIPLPSSPPLSSSSSNSLSLSGEASAAVLHQAKDATPVADPRLILQLGAKRKRDLPSPSRTGCVILEEIEDEYKRKPWKRRVVRQSSKPQAWQGRGRSPFKTPVTAVVDAIKCDSRLLEALKKELDLQKAQLEQIVATKQRELAAVMAEQENARQANTPQLGKIPVLPPPVKPPTRSASPARKVLMFLPRGTPHVILSSPESFLGSIPKDVLDLQEILLDGLEERLIPIELKDAVHKFEPHVRMPAHMFDDSQPHSSEFTRKYWRRVSKIKSEADKCQRKMKDENAWILEVVRRVLKWESLGRDCARSKEPFLQLQSIQTHAIDGEDLPVFEDNTITPKKIDLCLSFSDEHPDVQPHYAELNAFSVERVQISQMDDDYTSTLALFMGVEVKRQGEKETDAQAQLFTWLAAGVIHLRKLRLPDPQLPNLPLLGWTVVGHEWKLYVAYGEGDRVGDSIRILGPLNMEYGHTRGLKGIFQLLTLIQRLKTWAEATYWPWFTEHVVKSVLDELRN